MFRAIDNTLNSITMYRLMLYVLIGFTALAVGAGYAGALSFGGTWLLLSAGLLVGVCVVSNRLIARLLRASTNVESAAITALILFFVMSPAHNGTAALELAAVGGLAIASKYVLAFRKKHLFNPAAAGAVMAGFLGLSANAWWISDFLMLLPFVIVLGLLVVRKLRRFDLFVSFVIASLLAAMVTAALRGGWSLDALMRALQSSLTIGQLFFVGAVMLTEPITTPPTKKWRLLYGVIVGGLFGAPFNLGGFYITSEMALVLGNVFSFAVSLKERLTLRLKIKRQLAPEIFEFIFTPNRRFVFMPGQYLEWTLPHRHVDNRGGRRYFTIASSPTEPDVRLAVRIGPQHSSYKQALRSLKAGDTMVAGQLMGEFTLPKRRKQKLVFIAGGIGITPFRSMVQYLIDSQERRDVVLLYKCSRASEFVYTEVFADAQPYGIQTVYLAKDARQAPAGVTVTAGVIDSELITKKISAYQKRLYYLSGPPAMVATYKDLLRSLHIPRSQIKTDYFTGY